MCKEVAIKGTTDTYCVQGSCHQVNNCHVLCSRKLPSREQLTRSACKEVDGRAVGRERQKEGGENGYRSTGRRLKGKRELMNFMRVPRIIDDQSMQNVRSTPDLRMEY